MIITSLGIWMFCVIGMIIAYAISAVICTSKGRKNREAYVRSQNTPPR